MHLLCPVAAGFYSPSYGSLLVASLAIFRHGVMQTKGRAPGPFKLRLLVRLYLWEEEVGEVERRNRWQQIGLLQVGGVTAVFLCVVCCPGIAWGETCSWLIMEQLS